MPRHPRLLLSIHGIRTLGLWQRLLSEELQQEQYVHQPFTFGYFPIYRFLLGPARRKVVEDFHEWYITQCRAFEPDERRRAVRRPSIVAHSFGSYVVGACLSKYRDVVFDKLILCGSILPVDFDWGELLGRNQIWRVRNEFGLQDIWARLVRRIVPGTGPSGWRGFAYNSPCVQQERFDYHRHSDYFRRDHFRQQWKPFLDGASLAAEIRHGGELQTATEFERLLRRAHEIDTIAYGKLPGYQDVELPGGRSLEWITIEPNIYTFLIDRLGQRLIGYVNAMPLTDAAFADVLGGTKDDHEVVAADVTPLQGGRDVKLYLMSIAIEPGARVAADGVFQRTWEMLLWATERKLVDAWRKYGTRVAEVCAVGWTVEGQRICELLGLAHRGADKRGNPIYWATVLGKADPRGRPDSMIKRLRQEYERGRRP